MTRLVASLLALGAAAGCSFQGGNSAAITGRDSGPQDDAMVDGPLARFGDDIERWPVPASGTEGGFYAVSATDGAEQWSLLDLDGDGDLDLVQTADPERGRTVFGLDTTPFWRVYLSDGRVLSATPSEWPVPVAADADGFYATEERGWWALVDLTGDGLPDLVETRDPTTGEVWDEGSGPVWRVYANTGAAFAGGHASWPVPTSTVGVSFKSVDAYASAAGAWDIADLTGDGLIDLVHTSPPTTPVTSFEVTTNPHWLVYPSTGAGFASDPVVWRLPENGSSRGFNRLVDARWPLLDLDGDGALELVRTTDIQASAVFVDGQQPTWWVHDAESDGYTGTPQTWPVPSTSSPGGFLYARRARDNLYWTTLDIDADGKLDLVHTASHEAEQPAVWGSPDGDHWKVYLGTGSGFSAEAVSWRVPDSGLGDGFYGTDVGLESRSWVTVDLEGDGVVELVQTGDPGEPSGRVWGEGDGDPHWRVYRAVP